MDYYHIEEFQDWCMYTRNKYALKIDTWVETPCTRQRGWYTSGTLAFCQLCSSIVSSPKEEPVASDICTVLDESHPESQRQREQRELHVPHPHRHLRRPLQDLLEVDACQTTQHARAQGRAESYQF